MNVLGKLFNKKKTYPKDNKFEVLIIGEDKSNFQEILGITEERGKELLKMSLESYQKQDLFSDSCKEVVDECKHINEVVYAMSCLCRIKEATSSNPLEAILRKLTHGE
jgi:hypothetical protein